MSDNAAPPSEDRPPPREDAAPRGEDRPPPCEGTGPSSEDAQVGVGPHPEPWPDDDRLDPELLSDGDRRNVVDRYRYWRVEAIRDDLDRSASPLEVAIENWTHDFNIGTVVRNANAFGVRRVHIVGRRRWNRRGAMVTDRYLHVEHQRDVESLVAHARASGLDLVGIDNVEGAVPIEEVQLPQRSLLVFGTEADGLSVEALAACSVVCGITMYGSTRSLNAGVASGIAMYSWVRQHRPPGT
ncbi:MAG: TrmH family RNA methyltransferase [Microthrixaceae bacterium]